MRCERVPLAPHSAEFKDVEKQFRKSIKLTTVITSIERVQSSSMSKKYGRYVKFKLQYLGIPPRSGGDDLIIERVWGACCREVIIKVGLNGTYELPAFLSSGEQSLPDLPWSIL